MNAETRKALGQFATEKEKFALAIGSSNREAAITCREDARRIRNIIDNEQSEEPASPPIDLVAARQHLATIGSIARVLDLDKSVMSNELTVAYQSLYRALNPRPPA